MRLLVVNAGSSSLKLAVLDGTHLIASHTLERWTGEPDPASMQTVLADCGPLDAVGHRVVHGGPDRSGPVRLDPSVVTELAALTELAPLHQPRAVAGIRAVTELLPDVPAYACFDTAFHHGLPPGASTYALPRTWNERWRLRRYGFHGLSHAYAARRAANLLGRDLTSLRMVICHLGAGASLCAVREGRSVDTTMGFTPLEGLVMATRSGSVDPGLVLWLLEHADVSAAELSEVLARRSGLAGLSGTSGDVRDVLAAADRSEPDAQLALEVFHHRLAAQVAAMTAATGGLDVLVFTGGIGENSPVVRAEAAARLGYLGVAIDQARNASPPGDSDLSTPGAAVRTLVVTAREDLQVARDIEALLRP